MWTRIKDRDAVEVNHMRETDTLLSKFPRECPPDIEEENLVYTYCNISRFLSGPLKASFLIEVS